MVASITLGSFQFGPSNSTYIPQYGFTQTHNKGASTSPGWFVNTVSLSGTFMGNTHIDNMAAYNALMAAIHKHQQTLIITDGATIFNRTVYIDSHTLPLEWNSSIADFEITCTFLMPDVTTTGFTCSVNGLALDPIPTISKSYKYVREENRGPIKSTEIDITLSGFFAEGGFDANLAKVIAANVAIGSTSGTFIYNNGGVGINSTAYISTFDIPTQFPTDVSPYTIGLRVYLSDPGLPANIVEESVKVIDQAPFQRFVANYIPSINGRTIRNLGLSEARYSISGVVEADSFANAVSRIADILTANVPSGAILERQPQLSYNTGSARVNFGNEYSYNN